MKRDVTYIDDLLDLDEPSQRGAYNKVASHNSIKELPQPGNAVPFNNGNTIEQYSPILSEKQRHAPVSFNTNQRNNHLENMMNMNHIQPGHSGFSANIQPGHMISNMPGNMPGNIPGNMPGNVPGNMPNGFAPGSRMIEKYQQHIQRPPSPQIQEQPVQRIHKENFEKQRREYYDNLNCRDVAEHISNCPVCSKLYKPNNTIYIIIIIMLVVINLLCVKKLLS